MNAAKTKRQQKMAHAREIVEGYMTMQGHVVHWLTPHKANCHKCGCYGNVRTKKGVVMMFIPLSCGGKATTLHGWHSYGSLVK